MHDDPVTITLNQDEALVLYEWLARSDNAELLPTEPSRATRSVEDRRRARKAGERVCAQLQRSARPGAQIDC